MKDTYLSSGALYAIGRFKNVLFHSYDAHKPNNLISTTSQNNSTKFVKQNRTPLEVSNSTTFKSQLGRLDRKMKISIFLLGLVYK